VTPRRIRLLVGAAVLSVAVAGPSEGAADQSPPSADIRAYRAHMFDEPVRALANRSIALMFNTAPVKAGPRATPLARKPAPLDFRYDYDGTTHPAADIIERTSTDALLIIKHGAIVYERYFNRATSDTHFNSYSMAKSMNAIMVGLALQQGLIKSVAEPVTRFIPELKGTGYDGATIRDLMEMRSGTAWDENFFKPGTSAYNAHVASWVEERARYTDAALKMVREHQPGSYFRYNSMDAAVVGWVVERAAGMPVSRYMSRQLWSRAGMEKDAFYVIDGPPGIGREFTAGGFDAVLRDYGRIGLLMLNKGRINGRDFFPADFVANLSRDNPTSGEDGLGYGWFWWPVRGTRAVTALGGEGQYIFFDPDTQTVIVKMSHGPVGPPAVPIQAETIAFLKAASAWDGRP